jgi:intracellular septation protein A
MGGRSVIPFAGWNQIDKANMRRLRAVLTFVLWEFGPLLALLALSAAFSLKVAIAGTIAFILADASRRLWRRIPFTRIYLLSSGLAVIFGAIDLWAETPFMLKYEAVITNLATGAAFVAGARGPRSMMQEIAGQRRETFPDRADVRHFFRLLTLLWAVYFFLKAGLYLWLSVTLPAGRAIVARSIIGGVSLGIMVAVSTTQGRRMFFLCRRLGLLPVVAEPDQPKTP